MVNEFISPNWHVILIHYPIGLFSTGVLIELLTLVWRNSGLRTAGRWMILLGALLSVVTALAGVYAFRDVVTTGPIQLDRHWYELVEASGWSMEQWRFVERHVWLNGSGAVILVATAISWIALSPPLRNKLYWVVLALLVAALGLMTAGAWYGGEMVYQSGIGVEAVPSDGEIAKGAHQAHQNEDQAVNSHRHASKGLPLQLHVVFVGFTIALAGAAFALTTRFRRFAGAATGEGQKSTDVFAWWCTFFFALAAAVAGAWSVMGTFTPDPFAANWRELTDSEHRRLLWHVIFGLAVVVLPLTIALFGRLRARSARFAVVSILLLGAVMLQLWLGIHILFDSHSGPLGAFVQQPTTPETHEASAQKDPLAASDATRVAATVTMTNEKTYSPPKITVAVGATVEWKNPSFLVHTVTADPAKPLDPSHVHLPEEAKPFHSGDIESGENYRHRFTIPGHYRYFCVPHEAAGMFGEVIVTQKP